MGIRKSHRGRGVDIDLFMTGTPRSARERIKGAKPAERGFLEEFLGGPTRAVDCRYASRCTSYLDRCKRCRHNKARDYFSPRIKKR